MIKKKRVSESSRRHNIHTICQRRTGDKERNTTTGANSGGHHDEAGGHGVETYGVPSASRFSTLPRATTTKSIGTTARNPDSTTVGESALLATDSVLTPPPHGPKPEHEHKQNKKESRTIKRELSIGTCSSLMTWTFCS